MNRIPRISARIGARRVLSSLLVCAMLFSLGCATTVKTKVTAFKSHELVTAGGTIFVQALRDENTPSLEFAHYREILERRLQMLGYTIGDQQSQYKALLDYSVSTGSVADSRRDSVFIDTSATSVLRTGGRASVVVIDSPQEKSYQRKVTLVIAHNEPSLPRVYEVTGTSDGACAALSVVFDEMLEALLQEFPAANGSVKQIGIVGRDRC